MDWRHSSNADRKVLFSVTERMAWENNIGWNDLYSQAFGPADVASSYFHQNFQSGRISKRNAQRLYFWIRQNYPDYAAELEARLNIN